MKKLDTAILFTKMNIMEGFDLLIPFRILCGEADEKRVTFTDNFSNSVYVNSDLALDSDLPYSFNEVVPISELMKKYKTLSVPKVCQKYFEDVKKNAYFYQEGYLLEKMPLEDFHKKYGLSVTYTDTELLKDKMQRFIDGDLSVLDEVNSDDKESHESKSILDYKISEVCDGVRKRVIAQDDAVKQIVTAIYRNTIFDDPKMKSNIFVYGPTGCGKTEIVRTIGKMFDIPVLVEDMTRYTSAGYKGADLDDILVKLFYNADCDQDLAERSILVLDEIDKKASNNDDRSSFQKDDVLKSLLKIIEGGVFDVELEDHSVINFDTSKLTVITCGAFSDLYEKVKPPRAIGFGTPSTEVVEEKKQKVDIEAFTKYGIPVEFIGRMDTIVGLNPLSKNDLVRILKESEISPLKIYQDNLRKLNINIDFPDELCESIATKALEKYNTGARALKVIVDEMFQEILYGIFDAPGEIENLTVTNDTVNNNKVYQLRKKEVKKEASSEE